MTTDLLKIAEDKLQWARNERDRLMLEIERLNARLATTHTWVGDLQDIRDAIRSQP